VTESGEKRAAGKENVSTEKVPRGASSLEILKIEGSREQGDMQGTNALLTGEQREKKRGREEEREKNAWRSTCPKKKGSSAETPHEE